MLTQAQIRDEAQRIIKEGRRVEYSEISRNLKTTIARVMYVINNIQGLSDEIEILNDNLERQKIVDLYIQVPVHVDYVAIPWLLSRLQGSARV